MLSEKRFVEWAQKGIEMIGNERRQTYKTLIRIEGIHTERIT